MVKLGVLDFHTAHGLGGTSGNTLQKRVNKWHMVSRLSDFHARCNTFQAP